MTVERSRSVEWDGKALTGWVVIDGVPKKVTADRDVIHRHASGFNDAVTWEIEYHRVEIFEKLTPYFVETTRR